MIADSGAAAHVSFRVRGETLGHGEEVFLAREDDVNLANVSFLLSLLISDAMLNFIYQAIEDFYHNLRWCS